MIKAFLFFALALTLCQAMPASMELDQTKISEAIKEVAERIFQATSEMDLQERAAGMEALNHELLPVKREWMETTNGSVVPLFTVTREFLRDWVKVSNESVSEFNESALVKRVWNTMSEIERQTFTEPSSIIEFQDKKNQFTRELEEKNGEFTTHGLEWTSEAKRVWSESSNGTIEPMSKEQFERFLNESVVVPVKRDWLQEAEIEKRHWADMVRQSFNLTESVNLVRHSRSLSEEELRSHNVSEFVRMCDGSSQFKYYQPHPTNETLYIQCDSWGQPEVRACEEGLVWDQWRLRCCAPEHVKNATRVGYEFDLLRAVEALFDCNLPQYTCINGGVCKNESSFYKCECSSGFTGDLCEIKVDSSSIFSEILSGKFPFEQYREKLASERVEDEMKYFEQFKSELSQETYEELVKYLSTYKKGEVRYDRLVSNIIEDVLEDVYPDAFYLSVFNASSETVANAVRMIPNLLSYTKYSTERYVQVFYQYQKALEKLVELFNVTWPTVEREATEYYKLTSLYLNHTTVMDRKTTEGVSATQEIDGAFSFGSRPVAVHKTGLAGGVSPVEWTDAQLMEKVKSEFNETVPSQDDLFEFLEKFRLRALDEIKRDSKVARLPLGEVKFEFSREAVAKFDEIASSSRDIWESLCNYGFWFLTNFYSKQKF